MNGKKAWVTRIIPQVLTSNIVLPFLIDAPSMTPVPTFAIPALLINKSSGLPSSSFSTILALSLTDLSEVTSCSTVIMLGLSPNSDVCAPGSTPAKTLQPRSANVFAFKAPIPIAAPEMNTVFCSSIIPPLIINLRTWFIKNCF